MNNKMKKWVTLPVATAMALSSLAACSSNAPVKDSPSAAQPSEVKKATKITWYYPPIVSKVIKTVGDIAGMQEIIKRTGMEVEFQTPSAGDTSQQFNIMLASGSYPDVIFWPTDNYPGGLTKLYQDGVAIKLNDLIDKHAPNYKKLLDSNPELKKQAMLDDGTIAHFPKVELDLHRMSYYGLEVRKDWLDKLGLNTPKTVDEWYTVLKAFKEKDPNGNGQADEIPIADEKRAQTIKNFAAAWGVRADAFYLNPKTGKMTYGPIEPAYKDYLTTMNKWFKEGLIDSEFASNDVKAQDAKIADDKAGAWMGYTSAYAKWDELLKPKNPKFKIVGAPDPIGQAGQPYGSSDGLVRMISGEGAMITKSAKDPVSIVKLIDYMYSPEGLALINWGIEGESYVVENGKKKFADKILKNPEGIAFTDYVKKYAYPANGFTKVMDVEAWTQMELTTPEARDANKIWYESNKALLLPSLTLKPDESQKYAQIMSEVNTYLSENYIKFIMGAEPVSNYDQFVSTLKKLGIDEAIKIQQAAYDRYTARK
jgi:putative aldouronate transport system substrate-binding protein